jgi:asparagine synthase (glutamine-hydrolysing)
MLEALAHRGALHRETSTLGSIALGERLSARAEALEADRQATNEDGRITAVVDGAIYNGADLRAELTSKGHTFRTNGAGELICHLYEEFETAFPARIRGDFAFAVWDARNRRAVLGRDHMGVRPLYYARRDDLFLFASELKAVLATGAIAQDLDYEAIDAYLTLGFTPAPHTLLRAVSKLQAAHCLIVDSSGIRKQRYWELPESATAGHRDVDRHAEELLAVLDDAVRVRMDGQSGALLSGGLDSSLIVALMNRHATEPVKTFSVGFTEPGQPNELDEARWIAGTLGTDHRELQLSLAQATNELTKLVWSLDEPVADFGSLGLVAGAELAGRHAPLCFSGVGADGLLGGLPRMTVLAGHWDRLPQGARRLGGRLLAHGSARMQRAGRILGASDPAERFFAFGRLLATEQRARIVRGEVAALDGRTALHVIADRLGGLVADPMTNYIRISESLEADRLLQTFDRAASAGGLEMRLPFYDRRVVEYAASVPNHVKVRRMQKKFLLKHAARGLVPDRIIDKRKVAFLLDSHAAWLRAQVPGAIAAYLLAPEARYTEFLDRRAIETIVAEHAQNRVPRQSSFLFAVLLLEIWLSDYLPRALRCGRSDPLLDARSELAQEAFEPPPATQWPATSTRSEHF